MLVNVKNNFGLTKDQTIDKLVKSTYYTWNYNWYQREKSLFSVWLIHIYLKDHDLN